MKIIFMIISISSVIGFSQTKDKIFFDKEFFNKENTNNIVKLDNPPITFNFPETHYPVQQTYDQGQCWAYSGVNMTSYHPDPNFYSFLFALTKPQIVKVDNKTGLATHVGADYESYITFYNKYVHNLNSNQNLNSNRNLFQCSYDTVFNYLKSINPDLSDANILKQYQSLSSLVLTLNLNHVKSISEAYDKFQATLDSLDDDHTLAALLVKNNNPFPYSNKLLKIPTYLSSLITLDKKLNDSIKYKFEIWSGICNAANNAITDKNNPVTISLNTYLIHYQLKNDLNLTATSEIKKILIDNSKKQSEVSYILSIDLSEKQNSNRYHAVMSTSATLSGPSHDIIDFSYTDPNNFYGENLLATTSNPIDKAKSIFKIYSFEDVAPLSK